MKNKQIAETIIRQMGGPGKLKAMVNARNFACNEKGDLTFKFSGSRKYNLVKVELTPLDDYTIKFYKNTTEKKIIEGIYNDQLKEIFEEETGLRLSLF